MNTAPARAAKYEIEYVPTRSLSFDEENPRFKALLKEEGPATQDAIAELLWREFAVDEIALSIKANRFFPYEPLFAQRSGNRYVVLEGNRRLAAVRILLSDDLRKKLGGSSLPRLSAQARKELDSLPVVTTTRKELWRYVGFKHVNGPQAWTSYSKAQYIAWVRNTLDVSLDDIAATIGDRHATVERLYHALMVIEQAERARVYSLADRAKKHFSFSHLYVGLTYDGFKKFLGLTNGRAARKDPIPKDKLKELGEVCEWLYGSRSKGIEPVVRSQNPHLRQLDAVLRNRNGISSLRKGLPLRAAREATTGDEELFRQVLITGKRYLGEARARVLTGYKGDEDLWEIGQDLSTLAESVVEDMRGIRSRLSKRSRANTR